MSLPDALVRAVEAELGGTIRNASAVGGGCIAHATRLTTGDGRYFLKYGSAEVARTFGPEAEGLQALGAAASPLVVPEVVAAAAPSDGCPGFLLMTWIESGAKGTDFWEAFGQGLAALHRHTSDRYGFAQDNFIGRLPQRNAWAERWPAFFREHRLEPQVAMARERGRWRQGWNRPLDALYARLDDLMPGEPPASILHGDLWGGNFMVTASGRAALIDPAAYYGHREADLAMTELFGGFDERFYTAYRAAWPLESGYEMRRDVYNLYHLINHLNHFGGGYANSVTAILRRFG